MPCTSLAAARTSTARVRPALGCRLGGAGSQEVSPGVELVDTPGFPSQWKRTALATREVLRLLQRTQAPLQWTFLSSPMWLEPGPRTGQYRLGGDALLLDETGRSRLSLADCAVAMLGELGRPRHTGRRFAVAWLRREQNADLAAFGVGFDVYFLESSLYADGKVEETVRELVAHGHTYEDGGALWLRSTDFGDDKDRVMRKSDGTYTYFVPDVAYHLSKWQRGYTRAITELGADHHGSLARVKAGLQALDAGIPQGWPEYVLHQMVTVMRGGEEVKLSKRAGSYLTLRDLIDEAGRDATRWFLVARKPDSQLVFDIDLARSQSLDNPVYYVQLSHARICGLLRQMAERGLTFDLQNGLAQPLDMDDVALRDVLIDLSRWPEIVAAAGAQLEPHLIATYLLELAQVFQTYYNDHQFLVDDAAVRDARLALATAVRQVLRNGLALLGVQAPEAM